MDAIDADRYEINVGQTGLVARLSRLAAALADRAVERAVQGATQAARCHNANDTTDGD